MTYSSAICKNPTDSLKEAQINKYQRIIQNLDIKDAKVLEIGCGWGGFAEYAAKTTIEINSPKEGMALYDYAKKRLNGN